MLPHHESIFELRIHVKLQNLTSWDKLLILTHACTFFWTNLILNEDDIYAYKGNKIVYVPHKYHYSGITD